MRYLNFFVIVFLFSGSFLLSQPEKLLILPENLPKAEKPEMADLKEHINRVERTLSGYWELAFDYEIVNANYYGQGGAITYINQSGIFWYSEPYAHIVNEVSSSGEIISEFTLPDMPQVTGFSYDGTYVYAVDGGNVIKYFDPVTRELAGSIQIAYPYYAYSLSYDPDSDGFWVSIWHQDVVLINREGAAINSIPFANLSPAVNYGVAYDNVTEGGPYLWFFDISHGWNYPQVVYQVLVETGMPTGISINVGDELGGTNYYNLGGDLFISSTIVPGNLILGGILSGVPTNHLFGYNIAELGPPPGPGFAYAPFPAPLSNAVLTDNSPTLSWSNPSAALYNKLYFSSSAGEVISLNENALVLNGDSSMVYSQFQAPGRLEYNQSYFWRVVGFDEDDSTLGKIWSFRTRMEPAPLPPENISAEWNMNSGNVIITWTNPEYNIYNEPIEVDSTQILLAGEYLGSTQGPGDSIEISGIETGIYEFTLKSYSDQFTSDPVLSPSVGVNIFVNTYQRNNLNIHIPEGHGAPPAVDILPVTDIDSEALKVMVVIDTILHPWIGDLDIYLVAPDGEEVLLAGDNGGSGDNWINSKFDDDAQFSILHANAPMTGEWQPLHSLAALKGVNTYGDWQLKIYDDFPADQGILKAWSLIILTDVPQPNPNAILWQNEIQIEPLSSGGRSLFFGEATSGTDGIDEVLGEAILPPFPPQQAFDVRFELPVSPVEYSWTDFRDTSANNKSWKILLQPGENGLPFYLSWNIEDFPRNGSFTLKDAFTGDMLNVDMRSTDQALIDNPALTAFIIEQGVQMNMNMFVSSGWNLVSVPIMMENMTPGSVFENATSPVFGFDNSYHNNDILSPGNGYWVSFDIPHSISMSGEPVGTDHISLKAGWNLIGVLHASVNTSAVITEPAGIIGSYFYGYDYNYFLANMLVPGMGYWVRASADGYMFLNGGVAAKSSGNVKSVDNITPLSRIRITDSAGNTSELYLTDNSSYAQKSILPPMPPAGVFDIRFSSDLKAETLSGAKTININSANYPVTIESTGKKLNIRDAGKGNLFSATLAEGEKIVVDNPAVTSLIIENAVAPSTWTLAQNYPNPFNPSTKIKFSVPQSADVKLEIYNQLGQLVDILQNGQLDAGNYEFNWNAANYASGLYFYRLSAGGFSQVRKMMLLK